MIKLKFKFLLLFFIFLGASLIQATDHWSKVTDQIKKNKEKIGIIVFIGTIVYLTYKFYKNSTHKDLQITNKKVKGKNLTVSKGIIYLGGKYFDLLTNYPSNDGTLSMTSNKDGHTINGHPLIEK